MNDNKTIMVHRKHKKTEFNDLFETHSLDYVTILKHAFQISLTAIKLIPPKSSEKTENKKKYYKNQRINYIAFSSSCYLLINEVILAHKNIQNG